MLNEQDIWGSYEEYQKWYYNDTPYEEEEKADPIPIRVLLELTNQKKVY